MMQLRILSRFACLFAAIIMIVSLMACDAISEILGLKEDDPCGDSDNVSKTVSVGQVSSQAGSSHVENGTRTYTFAHTVEKICIHKHIDVIVTVLAYDYIERLFDVSVSVDYQIFYSVGLAVNRDFTHENNVNYHRWKAEDDVGLKHAFNDSEPGWCIVLVDVSFPTYGSKVQDDAYIDQSIHYVNTSVSLKKFKAPSE